MRCRSDPDRRWLSQGLAGKLIGGWQLNGILTLRGGFPTNIRTNVIPPIFNTFNVPDAVAGQPLVLPQSWRGRLFQSGRVDGARHDAECDRRAHSTVRNGRAAGGARARLEEYGRVRIQGLSTSRERHYLEFRTELFNATNTPTFFLPAASSSSLTCMGPAGTGV